MKNAGVALGDLQVGHVLDNRGVAIVDEDDDRGAVASAEGFYEVAKNELGIISPDIEMVDVGDLMELLKEFRLEDFRTGRVQRQVQMQDGMARKGVIGLANPQMLETPAVAREKFAQGTEQEGFAEPAGSGQKIILLSAFDEIIYILGLIRI
jgi:hypothetical protein